MGTWFGVGDRKRRTEITPIFVGSPFEMIEAVDRHAAEEACCPDLCRAGREGLSAEVVFDVDRSNPEVKVYLSLDTTYR